jgi:Uma2 family endonuclease
MNWQEVCEHPSLHDLPFKIELDQWGRIIMSPAKVYHAVYQAEIAFSLKFLLRKGRILTEYAIKTMKGTRVADVAWMSETRFSQVKHQTECSIAPEICVEVLSSCNTVDEMQEKRQLYFEQGAQEVWLCNEQGEMTFYNQNIKLANSILVPKFQPKINLDD